MVEIGIDVWLYGVLARYGKDADQGSHANLTPRLSAGSTVADLLAILGMPTTERGVTFINGDLSAMPGLQPDLGHVLQEGDRVALFDLKSMWPFQYRDGAAMIEEMRQATTSSGDRGLHHSYTSSETAPTHTES
jgi:hypothetical protein